MSQTATLERPASASGQSIQVDRDALLAALSAVGAVIESRNTILILSNYRLNAAGGSLTVTGTDLDTWSMMSVPAHGEIDTTVPADRLRGAISTLRPGALNVAVVNGELHITQNRSTRKLPTIPAQDFPAFKRSPTAMGFDMPARQLLGLLEAAKVAVSTEETRYYLCGVLLHNVDGNLTAAATDGIRIIEIRSALPAGAESMPGTIISTKGVNLICKLLANAREEDVVRLAITSRVIEVMNGQAEVHAKVIDGTFPDYSRVIPKDSTRTLAVHSAEFDRCVKAANAASDGKTRCVRLDLSPTDCRANGRAQDGGLADEPMDAQLTGEAISFGLNSSHIQSLIGVFGPTCPLEVAIVDGGTPIVITSTDRPGLRAGMMPMRAH